MSGPKDPVITGCIECTEEAQRFAPTETVYLQPYAWEPGLGCNGTDVWNLTAGDDETEVWREDNYCGGIALTDLDYKDFEFNGSFVPLDTDDDYIGFFFGYEDPGHFYLVVAGGDWDTHASYGNDTWRLVKVSSETSTSSSEMMRAIYSGVDVPGQTSILYRPEIKGWNKDHAYSWSLKYEPSKNSLLVSVYQDDTQLWNSIWDKTFDEEKVEGKVGVFTDSQPTRFYDMNVKSLCSV